MLQHALQCKKLHHSQLPSPPQLQSPWPPPPCWAQINSLINSRETLQRTCLSCVQCQRRKPPHVAKKSVQRAAGLAKRTKSTTTTKFVWNVAAQWCHNKSVLKIRTVCPSHAFNAVCLRAQQKTKKNKKNIKQQKQQNNSKSPAQTNLRDDDSVLFFFIVINVDRMHPVSSNCSFKSGFDFGWRFFNFALFFEFFIEEMLFNIWVRAIYGFLHPLSTMFDTNWWWLPPYLLCFGVCGCYTQDPPHLHNNYTPHQGTQSTFSTSHDNIHTTPIPTLRSYHNGQSFFLITKYYLFISTHTNAHSALPACGPPTHPHTQPPALIFHMHSHIPPTCSPFFFSTSFSFSHFHTHHHHPFPAHISLTPTHMLLRISHVSSPTRLSHNMTI